MLWNSIAWNFNLISSILMHSSFSSFCGPSLDPFDSTRSPLYLGHISGHSAVLWSLDLKEEERGNWDVERSTISGRKVMANLTRFGCMEWPFEMTVYWNVEMTICWGVEMIICWDVGDVLWCWLAVSISEAFRWGCICCVRYEGGPVGVQMTDVFF